MSMNAATEAAPAQQGSHRSNMDRMYRLQRHIYDVTRAYYLLGRDQMLRELSPPAGGLVLEIGCGTGRNLVKAASLYPERHFFGVDISDEMLKSATAKIDAAGLAHRISLFQGDATNLAIHPGLSQHRFDRIYFSYTLSMIPEWRSALVSATALLSSNGRLHCVDFGPCTGMPAVFTSSLRKWLSIFGVTPRDEIVRTLRESGLDEQFLAEYTLTHMGYSAHVSIKHRHTTVMKAS
jgi:S-adenosylmethionine-diacylgycerolhomoserine-N-methlytransferase